MSKTPSRYFSATRSGKKRIPANYGMRQILRFLIGGEATSRSHKSGSTIASWPRCVMRYCTKPGSVGDPQVAALYEAIERGADVQFANIASAPTGSFQLLQKL